MKSTDAKNAKGTKTASASTLAPADIDVRAELELVNIVRQEPVPHFSKDSCWLVVDDPPIRRRLGFPKDDRRELHPILSRAAERLNGRSRTFQVTVESYSSRSRKVVIQLANEVEWNDVMAEAWVLASEPNPSGLSIPGRRLAELLNQGGFGDGMLPERTITWKIGLHGREHCLEPFLREVAAKSSVPVRWEGARTKWGEHPTYRIWLDPSAARSEPDIPTLDLIYGFDFERYDRQQLDEAKHAIYDGLTSGAYTGGGWVSVLLISTRRDLKRYLPNHQRLSSRTPSAFFAAIRFHESLSVVYDFRDDAPKWQVSLKPSVDWETTLAAIAKERSQPSLQEQFGLSDTAAKLLAWIRELPPKEFMGRWTPIVEDEWEREIGEPCPWSDENFAAYLQLLLEEINERTDYALTLQPWHVYGRVKSRVRVAMKTTDLETVVQQLCWLAIRNGKRLDADAARKAVVDLVDLDSHT